MNLYPVDEAARIHRQQRLTVARRHRQPAPFAEVRRTRRAPRATAELV